jgi:hypothetical protein
MSVATHGQFTSSIYTTRKPSLLATLYLDGLCRYTFKKHVRSVFAGTVSGFVETNLLSVSTCIDTILETHLYHAQWCSYVV